MVKTFDEWSQAGYRIKKGSRAACVKNGVSYFSDFQVIKTRLNAEEAQHRGYHTFADWKNMGFAVYKDEKAVAFTEAGEGLFAENQTVEDSRPDPNDPLIQEMIEEGYGIEVPNR